MSELLGQNSLDPFCRETHQHVVRESSFGTFTVTTIPLPTDLSPSRTHRVEFSEVLIPMNSRTWGHDLWLKRRRWRARTVGERCVSSKEFLKKKQPSGTGGHGQKHEPPLSVSSSNIKGVPAHRNIYSRGKQNEHFLFHLFWQIHNCSRAWQTFSLLSQMRTD